MEVEERQVRLRNVMERTTRRACRIGWSRTRPTKRSRGGRERQGWDKVKDCNYIMRLGYGDMNQMDLCDEIKHMVKEEVASQEHEPTQNETQGATGQSNMSIHHEDKKIVNQGREGDQPRSSHK